VVWVDQVLILLFLWFLLCGLLLLQFASFGAREFGCAAPSFIIVIVIIIIFLLPFLLRFIIIVIVIVIFPIFLPSSPNE
jgi:hypothetical protein